MARGLPKSIIKKYGISKKAWEVYRGRKPYKRRTTKRNVVGVKKMPKRRYTRKVRRRRKSTQIPLAIMMPAVAPLIESALRPEFKAGIEQGDPLGAFSSFINVASMRYTGYSTYDHTWDIGRALPTWGSIVAGVLVHKLAGKHINPHLRKIPLIGKYIGI